MLFRYYSNRLNQASRALAAGVFIVGMVLIGFGFMIYLLPRFFAILAALTFCVIGIGCLLTAIKMFILQNKIEQADSDDTTVYRKNVRIHTGEFDDR